MILIVNNGNEIHEIHKTYKDIHKPVMIFTIEILVRIIEGSDNRGCTVILCVYTCTLLVFLYTCTCRSICHLAKEGKEFSVCTCSLIFPILFLCLLATCSLHFSFCVFLLTFFFCYLCVVRTFYRRYLTA